MSHPTEVSQEIYGQLPDGREVKIFTLTNQNGLRAKVTEYGAILVSMKTPDSSGKLADITLGFDTLADWLTNPPYLGASIGRFGNRIGGGKFTLEGKTYSLATNNAPGGIPCHLHGGIRGFDKVLWSGKPTSDHGVKFSYLSPHGEEGYPGNLQVEITYNLNENNELVWEAVATTDAPTIVNIVQHSYWNLSGDPTQTILDHELMIAATHYLPADAGMIPTGTIAPVEGTPMDFTRPTVVGSRAREDFEALKAANGYDACWVLEKAGGTRLAARVRDPKTGRVMEVSTNQPGVQFYTGNFLDGSITGKNDINYAKNSGLCLETEAFPDAPNKPEFPSAKLHPGQTYKHLMIHKFSA